MARSSPTPTRPRPTSSTARSQCRARRRREAASPSTRRRRSTCTATDAAGNVATSTFTVKVEDTQGSGAQLAVGDHGRGEWTRLAPASRSPRADRIWWTVPSPCTARPTRGLALRLRLDDCALLGHATPTATRSTGSFSVTVQDTTSPALTLPADITVEATGPSGATVTYPATATDIVDGDHDTDLRQGLGSDIRARHHHRHLLGHRCPRQHHRAAHSP